MKLTEFLNGHLVSGVLCCKLQVVCCMMECCKQIGYNIPT